MRGKALVLSAVCLCVFSVQATGATWRVEQDGSGDFTMIQEAIDAAAAGDLVLVGPGTYGDLHADSRGVQTIVELKSGVTVRAELGTEATILDATAEGERHAVTGYEVDVAASLEAFTVRGGDAPLGGGIFLSESEAKIVSNHIVGNAAGAGGGIVCEGAGTPTIEGNVVEDNDACCGEGGGILCTGGSSAQILRNEVYGNSGFTGGGIALSQAAEPVVNENLVTGNVALAGGGLGVITSGGQITYNRVLENEAQRGGGVTSWSGGGATFSHNIVARNVATGGEGGGYHISADAPELIHETIVANNAFIGAGVFSWNGASARLQGCIVALGIDGDGIYSEDRASVPEVICCDVYGNDFGDYGGAMNEVTGIDGNISIDPRFCDFDAGDYHLSANSPLRLMISSRGGGCGIRGALSDPCDRRAVSPSADRELFRMPFPNPSKGLVWIPSDRVVSRIGIVDVTGRRVRTLMTDDADYVVWDGCDDAGTPVVSGIYFVVGRDGGVASRVLLRR